MKYCPMKVTVASSRLTIGAVFTASVVPKLGAPERFLSNVMSYTLFSDGAAVIVAAVLPAVELVLAAALLAGVMLAGSLVLSVILLSAFVAIQSWALMMSIEVGCGCFSVASETLISWWTVGRTSLLLSIAVAGLAAMVLAGRRECAAGSVSAVAA